MYYSLRNFLQVYHVPGENANPNTCFFTGPGKVVLQTMTIRGLAGALSGHMPKGNA